MASFSFQNKMPVLSFSLILIFALVTSQPAGHAEPFLAIEEELSSLSLREDKLFQELFTLSLTLDNLDREAETLIKEMEQITDEIKELEQEIGLQQRLNQRTIQGLEQVLKTYQRMGPASYLEILLDSEDLGDFLGRINLLRDLAGNTERLLESIEESKTVLIKEKERHDDKIAELAAKQEQLEQTRQQAMALRKQMEERLSSLAKEKEYYQEQLTGMQHTWEKLMPFFSKTIKELTEIIEWDKIPLDAMKTRVSLRGIHGTLGEATFNEIIAGYPELSGVVFRFSPGQASLVLPESRLVLDGVFVIEEKTAIMFQVTRGTFYDLPLDDNSINKLLQNNRLVIDFKPLIGNNVLRSIEIGENKVELLLIPAFLQNQA